ncbi:hypothetical protein [Bartonella melophagi]|uniref:Spore coat protein U domain-containing protein n=1 Tax=Bartonella melophagi K-2C TaxID=1094557 RepID=J0ZSS9_9HYPH|nr:hypothetical protein [Bartonella melophagi]EJF91823.1 hypothetical protein ME3_00046 [Bartonella melophagi K-2C]
MNIKRFGVIILFIVSSNSSVQGANLMAMKGLALDVATTFASTDLYFGEQDSDSVNNAFLNISCTDQNKWTTNYGQRYTVSLTRSSQSRLNLRQNRKSQRSIWFRRHSFSY